MIIRSALSHFSFSDINFIFNLSSHGSFFSSGADLLTFLNYFQFSHVFLLCEDQTTSAYSTLGNIIVVMLLIMVLSI